MMRRTAIPMALLVLGALSFGVAQAEIVGDFPEVVAFGKTSVQIDQNATVIQGDAVTNQAGGTMSLGNKVTTPAGWQVKSDSLSVGNFVNLNGGVLCNFPAGGVTCAPLSPLPVYGQLPVFQDGSAGGPAVNVPNSGSTILNPGDYGALTVGVEGTVTFAGPGDFNFTSFTAGRKGQFIFTGGPIEIRVTGNFQTGVEDNINLAESPVAASDIAIYVGGNAEIGAKTNVHANFYVQGTLGLGSNVIAKGAFLAGQLIAGQKSTFQLSTFWDYQPVPEDDSATTDEDTAVTIDVLGNDSDPDGDDIFVNSVTPAANGTVTFTAGDVTYEPDADYFGPDSFTYEVCDVDTQINEDNCAEATVSVDVTSVNDPPVPADDSPTTPEDTPITIPVLANDTAGPANELQDKDITSVTDPANGRAEIVGVYPNEQITYSPFDNFNSPPTDSFDYTICDDGDGADDATVLCAIATVTVTVTPVNDPPVANAQSVSTNGDVNLQITLTGSDIDGDSLAFSVTAGPTKGAIVSGPTQLTPTSASVTYDPSSALDEPDQFTFQVDDGNGGIASAFVSINPFEGCVDDNDCLSGFFCNTTLGVCEELPLGDILAQDGEFETNTGEPVEILLQAAAPASIDDLTFTVGTPTSGSLSPVIPVDPVTTPIRSARTTYTPTCSPSGDPPVCSATFTFEACEAAVPSNCDTGTVTILVSDAASPAPPVALDQSVNAPVDGSVTINLVSPAGTSSAPDGRSCTQDSDCASGFVCDAGSCVEGP